MKTDLLPCSLCGKHALYFYLSDKESTHGLPQHIVICSFNQFHGQSRETTKEKAIIVWNKLQSGKSG